MSFSHVVVDGSNIATEGRSTPSLAQLDEAVREFRSEHPDAEITVVVDATFGHRIDPSERSAFDEAQAHGEAVSPPAGAIGRGDAFLLRIADRSGATVLSNDSFQEFHGEYEWLFTKGRLIGGKPVPGVGWIFTPRNPVRGPKSRESVREARRSRVRVGSKEASRPMPVPKAPPPRPSSGRGKSAVSDAIAAATEEAVSPKPSGSSRRRRRRSSPPAEAVNDPLTFIQFIAEHPLGSQVEGDVESFASHGAFVSVGGARCYIPLSAMGEPPPRAAREALERGSRRTFVLQALDAQRRGIELALPGFEHVSGRPQQETVEAEIAVTTGKKSGAEVPVGDRSADRKGAARKSAGDKSVAKKATPRKSAAQKTAPARKAAAGTTSAKTAAAKATVPKKTAARKTAAKKTATKAAAAKKTPAKAPAAKKTATGQKTTASRTSKAAKKTVATKAPAAKKTTAKRAASAKAPARTTTARKPAAAKKTGAEKKPAAPTRAAKTATATKKAAAKKSPARRAAAKD
ncbi:MAG TPA: hypothetical protein VFW24_03495 [Acidimicrobiales bacterium]|nr:hypothetical protein [Acidimicrobiales bacterium]